MWKTPNCYAESDLYDFLWTFEPRIIQYKDIFLRKEKKILYLLVTKICEQFFYILFFEVNGKKLNKLEKQNYGTLQITSGYKKLQDYNFFCLFSTRISLKNFN